MGEMYENWELYCKQCGLTKAYAADGFYGRKYKTFEEVIDDWNRNKKKEPCEDTVSKKKKCEFCESGKPLVIGKTNDQGIAIRYPNMLNAYGYDVHGFGSNGISVKIKYCPMCGARIIDPQESEK